jgi:hypothetical protein
MIFEITTNSIVMIVLHEIQFVLQEMKKVIRLSRFAPQNEPTLSRQLA